MNYQELLELHADRKMDYDQEHEQERIERLEQFARKSGFAGELAKKKLRELASGEDDGPDLPDISSLISHG